MGIWVIFWNSAASWAEDTVCMAPTVFWDVNSVTSPSPGFCCCRQGVAVSSGICPGPAARLLSGCRYSLHPAGVFQFHGGVSTVNFSYLSCYGFCVLPEDKGLCLSAVLEAFQSLFCWILFLPCAWFVPSFKSVKRLSMFFKSFFFFCILINFFGFVF